MSLVNLIEDELWESLMRWELREAWTIIKRDVELRHIVLFTAASIGMTSLVRVIASSVVSKRERGRLGKLRQRKQDEREQRLSALEQQLWHCQLSEAGVEELIGLTALELRAQLHSGLSTPRQALEAYQRNALKAHQITNCIVEPILEAQEEAKKLTAEFSKSKDQLLYGIPVSIKDCFGVKGYDCTIGCSMFIGQPFEEDAVIVQVLKEQGAIPFVRTNVPQTMISLESVNPIFGRTLNPHDTKRSSGGSSGGEAALIAAGGSILGIGSDIGGSLRCPAAHCGVCALKPTSFRISAKGKQRILTGQRDVPSCNGPMSKSVDGLILLMKALTGSPLMYQLDPTLPIQPFNNDILNEKSPLTIGYYDFNGDFEAIPAVVRAVHETKDRLVSLGYKVVPWNFLQGVSTELRSLFLKSLFADAGKELHELLRYDAVDDAMIFTYMGIRRPLFLRRAIYRISKLLNLPLASKIEFLCGHSDGAAAWKNYYRIKTLQAMVIDDWKQHGLDAVICPTYPTVAVPHGLFKYLNDGNGYLNIYNVLDFVAGTLPVSRVTEADVAQLSSYPSRVPDSKLYNMVRESMKDSTGLPVNVQVATLPCREELCLRVLKDIETAVATGK